jgi:hypothetical protein
MTTSMDIDLHGRVNVRLVDARPGDVRVIERQLGPLTPAAGRDPDLTIRFVDRIETSGPVRYLGHEEAGFTDDAYLILRGRHKAKVRVAVPMDRIGGPCEIVCERGLAAVPLLIGVLNITALGRGLVPVHGGAFVHGGQGVLVVGWAKGGKSETLIAFTAQGARFVGDEWIYVDRRSGWMWGLPEPMRVWDWQLRAMPGLAERVPAGDRRRLRLTRAGVTAMRTAGSVPWLGRSAPGRLAGRASVLLERQLSVQVPVDRLLGSPPLPDGSALDRLILVVSRESAGMEVGTADPEDLARRATASFLYETADLMAHYRRFRFAFPDRINPDLEGLEQRYVSALTEAVHGRPALIVQHPYPMDIPMLYDAISPWIA